MSAQKKPCTLREGYTTGTCAAAAAGVAVLLLLGGEVQSRTQITLPGGQVLTLPVEELRMEENRAVCGIQKDSGDDPDVTNGVVVYAAVEKMETGGVEIDGGVGVGRVTKRGLAVPVGGAAINPGPRDMITRQVRRAAEKYGYGGGLKVEVFIPAGVKLAGKTFNPRLGIEGGISVLGTSGVVKPMSKQALLDSIRLEMNVLREGGGEMIALTPGNYGQAFLMKTLGVPKPHIVQCGNFMGGALRFAGKLGFSGILLAGHIGKFIKLAGGMTNLHSGYGDCRMELLAAFAAAEGAAQALVQKLLACVTTDDALTVLAGAGLRKQTMARVMERIWFHVRSMSKEDMPLGVVVYSNEWGVLGTAGEAEGLIARMRLGSH